MITLIGFAPDADATTPGVIADCENFVPFLNGMEGAPEPLTPGATPALAAECRGAGVVIKLDDTRRIVAGTQTKLYELAAGAWSDVSKVGDYSGGVETRWSFTQFGDATIAANKTDAIQRSTSGAFADIAGAPKAEIVFTVGAFVMALNVNDGTEKQDGWHCCAAFDDTSWTPSITTQATSGRLVATTGRITAGMRLGDYAVAYKERSIYIGQYVGSPVVWDWAQVPGGDAGCVGKEAICDIGGAHFFVGEDNLWVFDGTRPVPVADGQVRQWFFNNSNPGYRYKIICVYDKQNSRVWIFYPSNSSSTLNSALIYHTVSKRWGRADRSIESALNYISPAATIDSLVDYSATITGLPDTPFDSQYWLTGGRAVSIFNASHQLQMMTGNTLSSSFTTGETGDDDQLTTLTRIRLRYADAPDSGSVQMSYQMRSGEGFTNGASGSMADGKFDVLQTARWHKARFDFTGSVKVTGMRADFKAAGLR